MSLLGRRIGIIVALAALVSIFAFNPIEGHITAFRLLSRMQTEDRSLSPRPGREITIPHLDAIGATTTGSVTNNVRARVYGPDVEHARLSIVLIHGIHHLGIDEPRLMRFAGQLAALGCRVLTPELSELAEYQVTRAGVDVIKSSVNFWAKPGRTTGLIGFSFGGGLSLLAAQEENTAKKLRYVASIGGYLNLQRTLTYLATNEAVGPHGIQERQAHEYGLLVLLYGHLKEFSLGKDNPILAAAFSAWLREDRPKARSLAKKLQGKKAKEFFSFLEAQQLARLEPSLLPIIESKKDLLAALSAGGSLSEIQTRVLLLHGSTDDVVPPEETEWGLHELEESVAHRDHQALVTPLLEHVRVDHPATIIEKIKLLHFIKALL